MRWAIILLFAPALAAQPAYDLLLRNGHLVDPKNGISGRRDVAIKDGRIANVSARIDPARAVKAIDLEGLHVTPGLIDLHAHIIPGAGLRGSLPIDQNVYADSHTLRSCVTTAVDAGSSGWRTFAAFRETVAGQVYTRVFALINIVGAGQGGGASEQNVDDMDPEATAAAIKANRDLIVGIKTAHYRGPEWVAVERAVKAGELAGVPVMVDYGAFRPERPFQELVLKKLRPNDIYTHTYLGAVPMLDENGKLLPYLLEARRRGVKFDVGHGGGSFLFRQAVPAIRQGFLPDSISTDLHTGSMNGAMNNMLNVMSKFLNMGMRLEDVVGSSTWNPARQIQRTELGHLGAGAPADIAVLRVETGTFGFVDVSGGKLTGTRRLACEMTIRDGHVVYDLNGLTRTEWDRLEKDYRADPASGWDWVIGSPRLGLNAPGARKQ
ncbi:MAG: amidohydrolase/deacetylase family metallohydrolase [Bryobacterales bacterium]|nr:amidohydrolase/deacetylase family metallohydrolase [Bryobacterales bacterium]